MALKPLKYTSLDGISEEQLKEHHDVLYAGYVNKVEEIRDKLKTIDKTKANQTYSDVRELKLEEGFALNGVKLHELYFDNLGGDGQPEELIKEKIEESFGDFEEWKNELMACGMSARGWVILALDPYDGLFHHFISDAHNQGIILETVPLLVLDTYEHAYFIDYATNRKAYLEVFLKNIDWKVVEDRYKSTVGG